MEAMDIKQAGIVFIGAGNMAEALVQGMITGKLCDPDRITVTDIAAERLNLFAERFKVRTSQDNQAAVSRANIVVLAVKPQVLPGVLAGIAEHVPQEALLISIAAGIPVKLIEIALPGAIRVVRVMPNTPALVGEGAAAICAGSHAGHADLDLAAAILGAVGSVVRVAEQDMDAVTALSGSGPAYVFYLVEGMLRAAEAMGLAPDIARDLACKTVRGAADLLQRSGEDPAELRRKVTSKGGTTQAAIRVLDEAGTQAAIVNALKAAQARSRSLSANALAGTPS